MQLPRLNDHPQVAEALAERNAAEKARDDVLQALRETENELNALRMKQKSQATAEGMLKIEELEARIPGLARDRELAQLQWQDAGAKLENARQAARLELKNSREVRKAISTKRKDLIKATKAFLDAHAAALDLEAEGEEAGLWKYYGQFGDAPPLAVRSALLEAPQFHNMLMAHVKALEAA